MIPYIFFASQKSIEEAKHLVESGTWKERGELNHERRFLSKLVGLTAQIELCSRLGLQTSKGLETHDVIINGKKWDIKTFSGYQELGQDDVCGVPAFQIEHDVDYYLFIKNRFNPDGPYNVAGYIPKPDFQRVMKSFRKGERIQVSDRTFAFTTDTFAVRVADLTPVRDLKSIWVANPPPGI